MFPGQRIAEVLGCKCSKAQVCDLRIAQLSHKVFRYLALKTMVKGTERHTSERRATSQTGPLVASETMQRKRRYRMSSACFTIGYFQMPTSRRGTRKQFGRCIFSWVEFSLGRFRWTSNRVCLENSSHTLGGRSTLKKSTRSRGTLKLATSRRGKWQAPTPCLALNLDAGTWGKPTTQDNTTNNDEVAIWLQIAGQKHRPRYKAWRGTAGWNYFTVLSSFGDEKIILQNEAVCIEILDPPSQQGYGQMQKEFRGNTDTRKRPFKNNR